MRNTQIFLILTIILSGALALGYFVFGFGSDYVNNNPVTGFETLTEFNPQNEKGMIFILGIMILLSAVVILRRGGDSAEKADND